MESSPLECLHNVYMSASLTYLLLNFKHRLSKNHVNIFNQSALTCVHI